MCVGRSMAVSVESGGKKLECSGADPIIDPLSAKHSYGMWEKYEPASDAVPTLLPAAFEKAVLGPLADFLLVDPARDTLILRHILVWTATNLPLAAFVLWYMENTFWNLVIFGGLHLFMWFTAMDTYVLQLHCISHRKVFKSFLAPVLYHYFVSILGPLFGETPETYYVHHIGMHHAYNNHFQDLSCTLPYVRDSFVDWLKYYGSFMVIHPQLFKLFYGRNNKLLARFFVGEGSWLLVMLYNLAARPMPTFIVMVLPVLIMRGGMMAGNWGQHAFINPKEPTTNLGHSVNIVDSAYNRRCFNDGYHIMHHLYPQAHYTELPQLFCKDLKVLAEHECIVFSHPKWDFAAIWFHLMIKDYDTLARHYVNIHPDRYVPQLGTHTHTHIHIHCATGRCLTKRSRHCCGPVLSASTTPRSLDPAATCLPSQRKTRRSSKALFVYLRILCCLPSIPPPHTSCCYSRFAPLCRSAPQRLGRPLAKPSQNTCKKKRRLPAL